jgi:hypothetical protein
MYRVSDLPDYHARMLLLIVHNPRVRLRDIAASLNITERSAFGTTDLGGAGTRSRRRTAAVAATTSRRTSRCQNRTAGNAPPGRSWPS